MLWSVLWVIAMTKTMKMDGTYSLVEETDDKQVTNKWKNIILWLSITKKNKAR